MTGEPALPITFRPRTARLVGYPLAAVLVAVPVLMALSLPSGSPGDFGVWDRWGFVLVVVAVAAALTRIVSVRAKADTTGLLVVNILRRRRVAWAEILGVRFGGGAPWPTLDLSDGSTLPVMAIQRADGPRSEALAHRLASIVVARSRTDRDD